MTDASEIEATGFYAKMSKPDAPMDGGILGAARSAQERPPVSPSNSSAKTASRDVEALSDPAERTVAEIDEERRQEEAGRANRLYDLPMETDGPRFDEPVMDTFAADIPDDLAVNLKDGEGEQIGQALIAAGLGNTTAASFMKMGVAASRNGPLSDHQIQQKNTDGMKVLEQRWGDQVSAKLELARSMIQDASAKWPGLPKYLEVTGLGSDPRLIQELVARADRRPGRR
jgi:hypothetical protein